MKVLALIPARAGSKGIPGKNLRPCAGRPLVDWSIEAAFASSLVDVVCVSSDAPEILARCHRRTSDHAEPFSLNRPAELATDEAATDPVLVQAVRALEHVFGLPEYVVLLQPTVPVRRPGLVDDCIRRAIETEADSLLTANPLHFVWWREQQAYLYAGHTGGPVPATWRSQCPRRPRRQDMRARELMFHEDGSVYVTRTDLLLQTSARLGGHMEIFETERTVDVDTEQDLAVAEALLLASRKEAVA